MNNIKKGVLLLIIASIFLPAVQTYLTELKEIETLSQKKENKRQF